jgi:predicted DNA-binding transcriptional regulator YafY
MYSGGNCRAVFRVCRAMIGDVIDLFGKDVVFSDETEDSMTVSVYTNEMSAAHFAQSFAPDVTVLGPKNLRENVKNQLQQALEKYQ